MAEEIPPSATFVRNLDERIKIPALTEALRDIFGEFGEIVDIVAKKNLKAKGQAFVVFDSVDAAQDAIDALQGFDLFEKPMTLAFAKSRSDKTVEREDGEAGYEAHKKARLAEKERKQAAETAAQEAAAAAAAAAKPNKRAAQEVLADRPAKSSTKSGVNSAAVVPEEYLPPNKIIIIRDFPDDFGKDELTAAFSRFPGFKEVRLVPGRKGIAFAEYLDESGATAAREGVNGQSLGGEGGKGVKVTYQRK
ncbi:uncharacterized protein K489DRAFT_389384 [Dissoconium aciculare CBS 342.82]|uniref:RRM domain-containing protein n=1 Tax=Dissoconium aciculare CBS 342.82 TaxID=1314786 RepID=A0A6J3M3A2_9PEZI|nr:uncharacterized protein K489DRAFT_389384 [Dissoconium aciculare CBS 342.82]KAF1821407.1 hypothetical protein K489DRAFT_389384 [Dissoconium aciculare CBS 342.82]